MWQGPCATMANRKAEGQMSGAEETKSTSGHSVFLQQLIQSIRNSINLFFLPTAPHLFEISSYYVTLARLELTM